MVFSPTDTIVAIATAPSRAGIGVVRISGTRGHDVARAILTVTHDLEPRHATRTYVRGKADSPAGRADQIFPCSPGSSDAPAGRAVQNLPCSPGSSDAPAGRAMQILPRGPGSSDAPAGRADQILPCSPGSSDPGSPKAQEAAALQPPPASRAIDEVVATFFPGPRSYTAEDVVEISAHGSVALLREIVEAAIGAGARLAEPGEFTLRAFLNGRLDLVQAEAVGDLIDAVTPLQARVAFDQLEGTLTGAIGALDRDLFDLAARLEASVDFPDEGYHFVALAETAGILRHVRDGVDGLLQTSGRGRVIREGRQIAILGKPNVGKSSLFNQLVGTDRAIVAAKPGTTRDMLSETIDFEGIRLGLVDTAGIRVSGDEVEQEGVWRARRAAEIADLVVLVLDQSRPLEDIDRALLRETAGAARVVVVNKIDLPPAWSAEDLVDRGIAPPGLKTRPTSSRSEERTQREAGPSDPAVGAAPGRPPTASRSEERTQMEAGSSDPAAGAAPGRPPTASRSEERTQMEAGSSDPAAGAAPGLDEGFRVNRHVVLSLKTGAGADDLRAAMRAALDVAEPLRDAAIVTNVRHDTLLRQAREALQRAIENLEQAGASASEELVLADLRDARRAFEEVTGRRTTEDVLKRIFERFCIGK